MDSFGESLEENVGFEALLPKWAKFSIDFRPSGRNFLENFVQMGENHWKILPTWAKADEDPNTFEEFLEMKEYIDLGYLFTTDRIFTSKDKLVHWAKRTAMNAKTYLIITQYRDQEQLTVDRMSHWLANAEVQLKNIKKPIVDDEEKEIPKKMRGPYETKICGCPFKLKGEQMAISESWQLFIHNGRHNHKVVVYNHEIYDVCSAQKIYNIVAKIKRNRMQGRNTVEEVLCLSAQRGYTIFHRNREESNVLSDIVIAHPTSIAMIRTWPYILIIDTTYKTNK
ncbi:hypothetical protein M9H77_01926 [Catharanthus roseus]|uniref:Uncharacterized protein n=1 Tax=Catharanthus roseus TaxID=4058 RepID=A0ACC0C7B2_CATRO|nr:hypothetical protein M9H77_01926 [Catharanthus roseus]